MGQYFLPGSTASALQHGSTEQSRQCSDQPEDIKNKVAASTTTSGVWYLKFIQSTVVQSQKWQ